MAKYKRFDPRNRKYGRHKAKSIDKDIRIKNVDHDKFLTRNDLKNISESVDVEENA